MIVCAKTHHRLQPLKPRDDGEGNVGRKAKVEILLVVERREMHVVVGFEQESLVIGSAELGHESQANERHLRLKIHGAWLAHDGIAVFGSKADTCVSYETDSSRIVGTRDFQIVIEARLYACIRAKQQPKVSEARAKQIADIAMHGITIHCPSRPCRRVLAILRIAISHFNIYYPSA